MTAPAAALTLPRQAPLGLWTRARLTLRQSGTVVLAVHTHGFSATRGAVALRLKDVDRPGSLRITPSVGGTSGPTVSARVTRPALTLRGWPRHAVLHRGGAPLVLTLTVHNTTDRRYPDLGVLFHAYAQSGSTYLTARELTLEQKAGRRWVRLPLAGGCDPGLAVALRPVAGRPLAPGATAVYRLRLRLSSGTPAVPREADAGLALSEGGDDFASLSLPFMLR